MVRKSEKELRKIEAGNLLEEAQEIFSNCIKCGMCKSLCPVFKVLKEESISPRGHSILITEKVLEKSLYLCTLCKLCEKNCPLKIKISEAVRKSREVMVLKNNELENNKELIKNIRKTGNPFGDGPIEPDKLYCC